jgi:2-C-methyl-D-erythritol 4-phosphate cytidylyltransferase
MERDGARPKLVTGSQTNIKITGPEDLELAELLLKSFGPDATTGNHANTDRTGV